MFSKIICSGDSFSSGYKLDNPKLAWPYLLGNKLNIPTINLAHEGIGNDYIITSIINSRSLIDSLIICGLTHYSRVEFLNAKTGKTFTTIPNRRGQSNFESVFWRDYYDDVYYYNKFLNQLELFTAWLQINNISYFLFDALPFNHYKKENIPNYLWQGEKNMCDIIYPHQLPDGHPNERGHEIMAENLFKIILDKFG
jgi:lysophospholipase L1-like esterase